MWRFLARCVFFQRRNLDRPQRIQPSSICVYGNVHDLVVCIQIYMTQYRNVIAFTTPLTPEQTITCYVTDPDTIADFLKE